MAAYGDPNRVCHSWHRGFGCVGRLQAAGDPHRCPYEHPAVLDYLNICHRHQRRQSCHQPCGRIHTNSPPTICRCPPLKMAVQGLVKDKLETTTAAGDERCEAARQLLRVLHPDRFQHAPFLTDLFLPTCQYLTEIVDQHRRRQSR